MRRPTKLIVMRAVQAAALAAHAAALAAKGKMQRADGNQNKLSAQ